MNAVSPSFTIPDSLNAKQPAELTYSRRDHVRLMTIDECATVMHGSFHDIVQQLHAGDVLVLNNSRTIPPVLRGTQGQQTIEVRLSRKVGAQTWEALIVGDMFQSNETIRFTDGVEAAVTGHGAERPLITLDFSIEGSALLDFIYQHGEPVRYEYIDDSFPLETYQTVYGSVPGSVEMASAGRAFTWQLLEKLKSKGVHIAFVQLHAGLSYYENDKWPSPTNHPEHFRVPRETASLLNEARKSGTRVIAVGTTVVRALESAVTEDGCVETREGVTRLYVDDQHTITSVDGLLTGFHEPEASHLHMLTAFLPYAKLMSAYHQALEQGYLWHEFGDLNLIFRQQP
ncbi:S-adenosylmethionine:tRNA ribosyltransferase-isomerase [Halobacillus locisalis]|uniref:S-adenosylmethionine:tRNA ribosyltransferase-isomerase n=1 Tax=Halobacillus locisalis TaxID=220753 RepID=A0A838CWJ1_9BACI|nr:S-adenosylmethionine:tRNA ribosyltransferase-isomerase [Halobacillus locisalis]MBA2176294.1 S-adenosylmethionine:tRNA ribosyltransferase-isomerase [Halobacillus locisalis]